MLGMRRFLQTANYKKISTPLADIFQFKTDKGILKLDRAAWKEKADAIEKKNAAANDPNNLPQGMQPNTPEALRYQARLLEEKARVLERQKYMGSVPPMYTLFQKIEQVTRQGSAQHFSQHGPSYGSHGGKKEWGSAFEGDLLSGQWNSDNDSDKMIFEEKKSPHRTVEFAMDQETGFRIQVSNPEGELILLRQEPDGAFSVVAMLAGKVKKYEADTFLALVRQNHLALEADVLPVLEQFGICLIAEPNSPQVQKVVLRLLLNTNDSEEKGKKLLADLASDDEETYEKAQRWLNGVYDQYGVEIQQKLLDKSTNQQLRDRLQSIVDDNPELRQVYQTIALLDLANDPECVVNILNDADPKDCPAIVRHLETITGQKFGTDLAAWKEWVQQKLGK
jgi:hypothetical protein